MTKQSNTLLLTNKRIIDEMLGSSDLSLLEQTITTQQQAYNRLLEQEQQGLIQPGPIQTLNELREMSTTVFSDVQNLLSIHPDKRPPVYQVGLGTMNPLSLAIAGSYALSIGGVVCSRLFPEIADMIYVFEGSDTQRDMLSVLNVACVGYVHRILGRSSHYLPGIKHIYMSKRLPQQRAMLTLGHEYAHFLQDIHGFRNKMRHSIFQEGHAVGIEKLLAQQYMQQTHDACFEHIVTKLRLRRLYTGYEWMCASTKRTAALTRPDTIAHSALDTRRLRLLGRPSAYTLGECFFTLQGCDSDPLVYQRLLKG